MSIFSKIARNKTTKESLLRTYKRWVAPASAVGFGALDVYMSKDKGSAIAANTASAVTSFAVRNMPGYAPMLYSTVAYASTRYLYNKVFNKPINPIKGHDSRHWGRETTFASGDFEPGSSWKGLLSVLRNPVGSIRAWQLGSKLTKGAKLYESMARYALGRQGIVPASVESIVMTQKTGPAIGVIQLRAVGQKGETLISSMRSFKPGEIGLTDIVIDKSLRGKGIGSFLRRGEAAIFTRMGYKGGTLMTSPVVNPITARIHMKTYGGELELVPKELQQRVLEGAMSQKVYDDLIGISTAVGRLPSSRALNKILGHDMRWGRSWVQRILKTDFMPGSSWIGQTPFFEKLIKSFAGVKAKQVTMREFAQAAGVRMLDRGVPVYEASKFKIGSGLTAFQAKSGKWIRSVPKTKYEMYLKGEGDFVPMVGSPSAINKKGYNVLASEASRQRYATTIAHESAEAIVARTGKIDIDFFRKYKHASADVVRLQGYFMHGAGYTKDTIKHYLSRFNATQQDMLQYLMEGYEYRALKVSTKVEAIKAEARINLAANSKKVSHMQAQMSRDPDLRPAGLPFRLNAQRNGSKGVRRDFRK